MQATTTPVQTLTLEASADHAEGIRTLSLEELAAVSGGVTETTEQQSQPITLPVTRW